MALKMVNVKEKATYPGRLNTDRSGEVYLGNTVTTEPTVLIHASDWVLRGFRPIDTCWYANGFLPYGYLYAMVVPAGVYLKKYPSGEVRVTPDASWPIYRIGRSKMDFVGVHIETHYTGWIASHVDEGYSSISDEGLAFLVLEGGK